LSAPSLLVQVHFEGVLDLSLLGQLLRLEPLLLLVLLAQNGAPFVEHLFLSLDRQVSSSWHDLGHRVDALVSLLRLQFALLTAWQERLALVLPQSRIGPRGDRLELEVVIYAFSLLGDRLDSVCRLSLRLSMADLNRKEPDRRRLTQVVRERTLKLRRRLHFASGLLHSVQLEALRGWCLTLVRLLPLGDAG